MRPLEIVDASLLEARQQTAAQKSSMKLSSKFVA
jgi:hypothetical protein